MKEYCIMCVRPAVEEYVRDFEPDLTREEFEDAVDYVCAALVDYVYDALFPSLGDEIVRGILDSWEEERTPW